MSYLRGIYGVSLGQGVLELLQELRIGFANAGGVVYLVAGNQQCHRHAMVGIGAVLTHGTQAVGLL